MRSRSKGFSLIELILSGIIGMLIVAGAYALYTTARLDQKTKQTVDLVSELLQSAQAITTTSTQFKIENADGSGSRDVQVEDIVNAKGGMGEFPDYTVLNGTNISHPLGGDISMLTESSAPTTNDLVAITLTDIPDGQCTILLSRLTDLNIYDLYVDDKLVALEPAATANAIGRDDVNARQASTICREGGDTVTIKIRQLKELNISKMRFGPYAATMSASEAAFLNPLYARQETAFALREEAQLAIP